MRAELVLFALGCLVGRPDPCGAADPVTNWEERAVEVLVAGDRAALRELAAEFRKLSATARGKLPLRIREDTVEFTYRGEFPGDVTPWSMLEYLVGPKEKDYESLLVVSDAEMKRVDALLPFFKKHAGIGRQKWWAARLVWSEGGAPHSADLADLLLKVAAKDATEFLDGLTVNSTALGGTINLEVDSASLPHRRVPATLLFTLRIAAAK